MNWDPVEIEAELVDDFQIKYKFYICPYNLRYKYRVNGSREHIGYMLYPTGTRYLHLGIGAPLGSGELKKEAKIKVIYNRNKPEQSSMYIDLPATWHVIFILGIMIAVVIAVLILFPRIIFRNSIKKE